MSFNVLYVENDPNDVRRVEDAVTEYNASNKGETLNLVWAKSPEEISGKLGLHIDLVLTDVYFDDPITKERDAVARLDDIIGIIESTKGQNGGRPLPIIAYTGRSKEGLAEILNRRDHLFDIWDKSTASPPYVAWRLSRLAIEVSRIRPDALMQRLIREMPNGAKWHRHIVEMTRRYDAGWTESEQILGAGKYVEQIAHELKVWDFCEPMWRTMTQWEMLGRAVSRRARGHARHVINVLWLGYYLLHNPLLKDFFVRSWQTVLTDRANMGAASDLDPLEALSDTWFYAAIFHDVAACIEKAQDVITTQQDVMTPFKTLGIPFPQLLEIPNTFNEKIDDLLYEFGSSLRASLREAFDSSIKAQKPDHGVVAAMCLRELQAPGPQACFTREAARAMATHNLIHRLPCRGGAPLIAWQKEPISCLLLLCDQLQTWDRERDDKRLSEQTNPERAELSAFKLTQDGDRPHVSMSIDYIAPPHLSLVSQLYTETKDNLDYILRDKPNRALARLATPWPFSLDVNCFLSGDRLDTVMQFA